MVRFFIGAATAGGVLLGLAAAEFPGPGMTEVRPACGAAYEIRRGDSLYEIAERVYRDGREFERIFEANRDRLTSPASIREGDTILIPCLVPHWPPRSRKGSRSRPGLSAIRPPPRRPPLRRRSAW
jgi:hypothetical protein